MNYFKITKYIFLSTLIVACSDYRPDSNIDKEISTTNVTVVDNSKDKSIEDGIYYLYKSCQYESKSSKPNCEKNSIEIWDPLNLDNNYVVRLNTSFDDFYLIKKGKTQQVYFYSNFIENPISGWFEATLTANNKGFKLSRDSYYQNFGYKNDGSFDELPDSPYQGKDYIPINSVEKTFVVDEIESIELVNYNGEFYVDCTNYEVMNENISGSLSVSCYEKDALWLKKID